MVTDDFSEKVTRKNEEEPAIKREHFRLTKGSEVKTSLACERNSEETSVVGDHKQRVGENSKS